MGTPPPPPPGAGCRGRGSHRAEGKPRHGSLARSPGGADAPQPRSGQTSNLKWTMNASRGPQGSPTPACSEPRRTLGSGHPAGNGGLRKSYWVKQKSVPWWFCPWVSKAVCLGPSAYFCHLPVATSPQAHKPTIILLPILLNNIHASISFGKTSCSCGPG